MNHIRLFSTDLDGTLLGNPVAATRFNETWAALDRGRRPLLVYNTSRTTAETRSLVSARQITEPDYVIGCLGTELHDALYEGTSDFQQQFLSGWDLARVERIVGSLPAVKPQPTAAFHPYKSSWCWERARREEIADLERRFGEAGLLVKLVYSCRYFLDVVPARAGKGAALAWLCRRLQVPFEEVLVAGDSAHDAGMFQLRGVKGIVVQNALPELLGEISHLPVFVAPSALADGVLEGLRHYDVLDDARPAEWPKSRAVGASGT